MSVRDAAPWVLSAASSLTAIIAGMLTALPTIPGKNAWTVMWAALGIFAVTFGALSLHSGLKRRERVCELKHRIKTLTEELDATKEEFKENRAAVEATLGKAGRLLLAECGIDYDDTRVTIYQRDDSRRIFTILSRQSRSPKLEEHEQSTYPDNVGLIAKAWKHGSALYRDWPASRDKWIERSELRFQMPHSDLASVKMRSRSMGGVRVDDGEHRVGVLIIESTDPKRITGQHIDTIKKHAAYQILPALLQDLRPPSL